MKTAMLGLLAEAGTEAFPVISFIARSELRDGDLEARRSY